MPLWIEKHFPDKRSRLVIWNTIENSDELSMFITLNQEESFKFHAITNEKRRREWLVTQVLLKQFFPDKEPYYSESGKPMFKDGSFLSISHCDALVGIVVSDNPIGMDIQNPNEKLFRIREKFCNQRELSYLPKEDILPYLTIIWSAKEAIFKVFGENVLFADHILVRPFTPINSVITAEYKGTHGQNIFNLIHLQKEEYHVLIAEHKL